MLIWSFFFFKQKTAYEMRISDWSSDVCSSDLASVPKSRLYGRYITHVWVWINTLSLRIRDSMLGFRVYPLAITLQIWRTQHVGRRMDFDTEIMVRLFWADVDVLSLPTRVTYPSDGVSHFDVWRDNLRISGDRKSTRLNSSH